ncbi:MAG: SDR family NAD(P)-dependent oxidoreductase [Parvibaculaceae bacterium]
MTDTVSVVTGGASGIGFETARALGAAGSTVVLLDRNEDGLTQAGSALRAAGVAVAAAERLDVTEPAAVTQMADRLHDEFGAADVLVNSAGIARLNTGLATPDDEWRLVMDVNVNGTYWCCRAFGRHMIARGKGSIVNLGSMSGIIVNRPQTSPSYMASKGAVHQLTRALGAEWARSGVRVNALAPGYVGTDMTLKMRERPELFNVWLDMTPMGRCGEPSEIAAAALFLASAASSYITGSVLSIDGGYTAW